MSELRRNAIRRKTKPKRRAGFPVKKCPESAGECSGQVSADSRLMGLSSSCQTSKTLEAFVPVKQLRCQAFECSLRNLKNTLNGHLLKYFGPPVNVRNGNM